METLSLFLSPIALALLFIWNFAVLSGAQLTVRLIKAYDLATTALAALLLTAGGLPITVLYLFVADLTAGDAPFRSRLLWLPLPVLLLGVVGFVLARIVLRQRRLRGALFTAVAVGLLAAPWPALAPGV